MWIGPKIICRLPDSIFHFLPDPGAVSPKPLAQCEKFLSAQSPHPRRQEAVCSLPNTLMSAEPVHASKELCFFFFSNVIYLFLKCAHYGLLKYKMFTFLAGKKFH